jgi:hypothetical protein
VGLELAAVFYAEVIRHLVRVPHAAALLGEGSEVLGYDDARSEDHAWGPRLIIFVDHDDVGLVRRAVDAGLPETFCGHQVRFYASQDRTVRHHVEVVTVADCCRGASCRSDATGPTPNGSAWRSRSSTPPMGLQPTWISFWAATIRPGDRGTGHCA